ncbi:helix-turn-helix domain-containing protein [Bariatricus sp. SGI.154]|uniref:helix-turn-helix domain-containing protein n=1 Tax=Bariatricus sp. SGI.154 TaxID=3420549 RepID=UPI003D03B9B0
MELGKQIKRYRKERSLSQDVLAEKVYVSRQTISNWENDKSYPDVKSLVLLSEVFDVSLDQLIKGDVKMMKEQINKEDQEGFGHLSWIFTVMLLATMLTPVPLVHFLSYVGVGIWLVIFGVAMYTAGLVEKAKKRYDIQTYREILAFMEGTNLDEIEKAREEGKRLYQTIFMAAAAGVITLIVSIVFMWILGF